MPARSIATFTAAATFSTMLTRPISSGSSGSLIAKPVVRRGSAFDGSSSATSVVAKMVACGLITPSVPPDQTIGISLTLAASAPRATSASRKARSAMMRV